MGIVEDGPQARLLAAEHCLSHAAVAEQVTDLAVASVPGQMLAYLSFPGPGDAPVDGRQRQGMCVVGLQVKRQQLFEPGVETSRQLRKELAEVLQDPVLPQGSAD